jgi:hypothetical protein
LGPVKRKQHTCGTVAKEIRYDAPAVYTPNYPVGHRSECTQYGSLALAHRVRRKGGKDGSGGGQASSGAEWAVWDVWDSGSGCGDPECVWTICSGEQGTDSRLMLYV